jgi:hypothetical protein
MPHTTLDPEMTADRTYLDEWFEIFEAGDYPQGQFTQKDVADIAMNYDPNFCEAPAWIGHPDMSVEPEALGWVYKCRANGLKLEVQFSYLDNEFIDLVNKKRFKYCSIELWKFAEKPGWYLFAIGLTNRPQVKGLKPLDEQIKGFSMQSVIDRVSFNTKIKFKFHKTSDKEHKIISQPKTINQMKIEDIRKFAEQHSIDLAGCEDDASIIGAVEKYVTKVENERDIANTQIAKFTDETKTLEERLVKLEEGNIKNIIQMGIAAKKVLTSEEASLLSFGQKQGVIELQKLITDRPVLGIFVQGAVETKEPTGKLDFSQKKFLNDDGSPMNWAQFSLKVHDNPSFADNFTEAEQLAIKKGEVKI